MGPWLLPLAAGALWAGILAGPVAAARLGGTPGPGHLLGVATAALGLALVVAPRRREPGEGVPTAPGRARPLVALTVALVGLVLLGGGTWAVHERRLEGSVLRRLTEERLEVVGTLRNDPRPGRFGWSAVASVSSVDWGGGSARITESVWVSGEGAPPDLVRGDVILLACTVEVPGEEFGESLRRQGIAVAARAREVRVLGGRSNPVARAADGARAWIARSVGSLFPEREGGLLLGLATGDKRAVDPGIQRDFRAAGLPHLLVFSGTHLAMVLAPLLGLALLLRLPLAVRCALGIAAIVFFILLTGAQPSVLRAGLMSGLALTGLALGRPRSSASSLAGAVFLLLLLDPRLATSVAFQLSVAATTGIVVVASPLANRMSFLPRPLALAAGTTTAAQAGVLPLLLAYFHEVPLVALLANVLAIPAVGPAMLLGLGAAAAGAVVPGLGRVLAAAALVPLRYLEAVADRLASAPVAWVTSEGGLAVLFGGLAVVGVLGWWVRTRRRLPRVAVAVLVLLVPVLVWGPALRSGPPGELVVRFFDVGQGDAALLSTPEGANVLIDGGPDEVQVSTKLAALGVKRLDVLVASHPHADHIVGLPTVLSRFAVGLVLEPGCPSDSDLHAGLLAAIEEEGVPVRRPRAGESLTLGSLRLDVLSPHECWRGTGSDPNNDSLVLRATYGPHTILFATEPEEPAQEALLGFGTDLTAELLKVPHHGARTSTPGFFEAVAADHAVVSVGPNPYGHPVPEVLGWIRDAGAEVLRTDRLGDITVSFGPHGARVRYGST